MDPNQIPVWNVCLGVSFAFAQPSAFVRFVAARAVLSRVNRPRHGAV
jgi:hypothetical protein